MSKARHRRSGFCNPTNPTKIHESCRKADCPCDCGVGIHQDSAGETPPAPVTEVSSTSVGVERSPADQTTTTGQAAAVGGEAGAGVQPVPVVVTSLRVYPDLEQGTEEWHDARRGILTASVVGQLVTSRTLTAIEFECPDCGVSAYSPCVGKRDGKPIASLHPARTAAARDDDSPPVLEVARNDYSRSLTSTLIAERITGWSDDTPMTSDMWRGVEHEPHARDAYSAHYHQAEVMGFMVREAPAWTLGYSPDGLVGTDGAIEIKCPRAKTHLNTILADEVPAQYMPQLQAGMLVSGRKWVDFVSFVAGMPLFVKRVHPDPAWFDVITAACIAFEETATKTVADYHKRVRDMPKTKRLDFEIKVA